MGRVAPGQADVAGSQAAQATIVLEGIEAVATMKRGELWWARLDLPAGRRPVALVSRDAAYTVRQSITVAEVSTVVRVIPSEVALSKRDGMPRPCVINTDNLVTIPKTLLESHIASLSAAKLGELDFALQFSLGLR
jgi:mRNA interferase MazF